MPVERISDPLDCRLDRYRQLIQRNQTRGSGSFIAEGRYVVERLIASRFPVESVVATESRYLQLREHLRPETIVYILPRSVVKKLVGFDFHAGVLACGIRQPLSDLDALMKHAPRRFILAVCPRTTDPVNLGNIVRLCSAFGVQALLLGPNGPDPFSRRVLRVSMGNVFSLPIVESTNLASDLIRLGERHGIELAALVLDPTATPLEAISRPPRLAVLFGHEGEGLTPEWVRCCDHRWTIKMAKGTDSLNVAAAAAIALYHLARLT